jgi:hypothetical protein
MKKLVLSFLALPLLLPISASSQNHGSGKFSAAKPITISGRVSEDGKSLIAKNGEPWSVTNPDALAGHESQQVKVKCQKESADHSVRVLWVKTVPTQIKYAPNPSDSAFRR